MATAVRNTGTRFRFYGDDNLWHAKVRVTQVSSDGERFLEFVTKVATLIELLAWLADIFNGISAQPLTTVAGHTGPKAIVTAEEP